MRLLEPLKFARDHSAKPVRGHRKRSGAKYERPSGDMTARLHRGVTIALTRQSLLSVTTGYRSSLRNAGPECPPGPAQYVDPATL